MMIIIVIIIIIDSFPKRNSPKSKCKLNSLYITHDITDTKYFNT